MGRPTGTPTFAVVAATCVLWLLPFFTTAHAADAERSLCLMLEAAAKTNALPTAFLARVIWRESRFDANAIGPLTRSGQRAQGIAQFMPGTASDRGLADPFDPVQALPKAAAFLHDLRVEFGNLGLAAAAYNAGPARVRGWLAGTRTMPAETRAYVWAITGRGVDDWAKAGPVDMQVSPMDCERLMASLKQPGEFVYELRRRVETALAKPWGIQLAAGFSRDLVLNHYARVIGKLRETDSPDPILTASRDRGLPRVYKAWIGADTRAAANTLCARIRSSGGACIVLRAPRGA
jgi:hypothetical protein